MNYRGFPLIILKHIIEERAERFPEEIKNFPSDVLAEKIRAAITTGLRMLERDVTYAKPSYSTKLKGISWFLPLHIVKGLNEEPELVLAINQNTEMDVVYYEVRTVLAYDDEIKDRITAVSLYGKHW